MDRLINLIKLFLNEHGKMRGIRRAISASAAVIVFVTSYALILPALTLDTQEAAEQPGVVLENCLQEQEPEPEQPDQPAEDEVPGAELPTEESPEAVQDPAQESPALITTPTTLTCRGADYSVTASFDASAEFPQGVELEVQEILEEQKTRGAKGNRASAPAEITEEETRSYEEYAASTEEALGLEEGSAKYLRLFDIRLVLDGEKVQPAEGSKVDVKIELEDAESENLRVVHFADESEEGEPVETTTEEGEKGQAVEFQAEGFSVYAVVDAPEPVNFDPQKVTSVGEIEEGKAYLLSYGNQEKYFTSDLNGQGALVETADVSQAAEWYFLKGDQEGTFYVYTLIGGERQYIRQDTGNKIKLAEEGTPLALSGSSRENAFLFRHGSENRWLQHSNGGGGIRFWTDANNLVNAGIYITDAETTEPTDDPYELDGKSYGIAFHDESTTAAAVMAEEKQAGGQQRLAGQDLKIRPDVLNHKGVLLVAANADITEWTFESVREDKYYLTATVNGEKKYLTVDGANVSLSDSPDAVKSLITAVTGTGEAAGKWHFLTSGGRALHFAGSAANGFNAAGAGESGTWMNLVEKSAMTEEDFTEYTARKVSVSDTENVYDGKQVIIYTRVWNDTAKKYEFYAVDHDGSLFRVYDTGDGIRWVGSQVNTALWDFREGTDEEGALNHYYWLQNSQYRENCISPRITSGQVVCRTDDPEHVETDFDASVNLDGRRYGRNHTTIIAWDEKQYAYSGLKAGDGQVEACALTEAEPFYFAVIDPAGPEEQLTTVRTVDGTQHGITMKMIDFNNGNIGTQDSPRDAVQNPFFGGNIDKPGLLSTDLTGGYPTTTDVTGRAGHSLSELYNSENGDMTDVNHLFIESIYNESGYFEYDSTSNFAHLEEDGNFKVYDQLGSINDYNRPTGTHGQFMPYNDLTPGKHCPFTNQTDVLARELSDTDVRKGETLYDIGRRREVNYQFGMEMTAGFTQTASGLDAWGHDIIFEFSGDDDFWFYVDGELVLDLGGVHSAMTGSINFRTGEVKSSRGNSTLYETFRENYRARELSEAQIAAKLEELFEEKTVDGNTVYVFRDYTNHEMRMFYMERGAGASNLRMRFNLAAVKPGSFLLSKKLSGTDNEANDLIEFPYQIWYQDPDSGEWKTLSDRSLVVYEGTSRSVRYAARYTPSGGTETYRDVFFLKPGQSAEVTVPGDGENQLYRVVECGVDPNVYDHVYANSTELTGTDPGNDGREDYATADAATKDRPKVDYVNHVREDAVRSLSISKKLYDADGETALSYDAEDPALRDETLFDFRLYLGDENTAGDSIPPADTYSYYIRNSDGEYCRWDASRQRFVSLGIRTYADLLELFRTGKWSEADKEAVIFRTSMSGAVSRIPAGYTVEVRDLIVGTRWKAEERDREIPRGSTRRDADGYVRTDTSPQIEQSGPFEGVMQPEESPAVEIRNQKGWGLTVRKIWSDRDFMESHDPIYMAVYVKEKDAGGNETGREILYDGSVRRLTSGETELYYFFDDLAYQSGETEIRYKFSDFVIREVALTGDGISVGDDGTVTGYDSIGPIPEDGTLTVGGTTVSGRYRPDYSYKVRYTVGESSGRNENIRTDTVSNERPGIRIFKTDWTGAAYLPGAVFTLQDPSGADVARASYTSDADGLVTTAYLAEGTYTLREIQAPAGYAASDHPFTITVGEDGRATVSGDAGFYEYTPAEGTEMARITVRNRTVRPLTAKKVGEDGQPLAGAHFALYRQVKDASGNPRKDYLPMTGLEDIVTGADGILPGIGMQIGAGTYYLTETRAASGYKRLPDDLCLTIGKDGTVTVNTEKYAGWLTREEETPGSISYALTVPNTPLGITFRKTDPAGTALKGSRFALARLSEDGMWVVPEDLVPESGEIDLSDRTEITFTGVPDGRYRLTELGAPEGYLVLSEKIWFEVRNGAILLTDGSGEETAYEQVSLADEGTTILVSNAPGAALPNAGGHGIRTFTIPGAVLTLLAGLVLLLRRFLRPGRNLPA